MPGSTSFKTGLPVELVSLTNKGFTLEYTNVMLLNVPV